MALRSSIYVTASIPTDQDGARLPGYIPVGETPGGRIVLHAAPGVPPLDGMEVIVDGSRREWTPDEVLIAYPDAGPLVLEAEWEETGPDGETFVRRGKMAEVPSGVTPLRTGLLPHLWMGEEPDA